MSFHESKCFHRHSVCKDMGASRSAKFLQPRHNYAAEGQITLDWHAHFGTAAAWARNSSPTIPGFFIQGMWMREENTAKQMIEKEFLTGQRADVSNFQHAVKSECVGKQINQSSNAPNVCPQTSGFLWISHITWPNLVKYSTRLMS